MYKTVNYQVNIWIYPTLKSQIYDKCFFLIELYENIMPRTV